MTGGHITIPDEEMSPFKAGGQGRWLTKALFYELSPGADSNIMFTTKPQAIVRKGKTLNSFKQLYLSMEDVTEYEFANRYLGGWEHWRAMLDSAVRPLIDECREELSLMLRARGMRRMIKEAQEGKGTDAAKFLIAKGWEENKRGRPSKQDIAKKAAEDAELANRIQEDFERIGVLQ